MPKLTYKAFDFKNPRWGKHLEGEHTIDLTWSEIMWAAITVGKQNLHDVYKYKNFSMYEAIFRATMIFATLKEKKENNKLVRTDNYELLDPSEKTAISYFQGLMTSKLLAQKLLDTAWLMHLDVYDKVHIPTMVAGTKSRPDFMGRNNAGEWIVIEAKGRSNSYDKKAQEKAKDQTKKLKTIDGNKPILGAAVQSYITSAGYFRSRIDDPEEIQDDAINVQINQDKFLKLYYGPIIKLIYENNAIKKEHTICNNTYLIIEINEIDLTIGIEKSIYSVILDKKTDFLELEKILLRNELGGWKNKDGTTFVGADGILITTGPKWASKNMFLEPEERQ
ncbi:hypothetical protein COM08_15470 [Bacillus wiedmannii]|uniref:hypothetical protein n=1 Tax=Bacillus TaxID=1386 RepID=UPI000BF58755|nr:hypothetical protein [Bacillus wiedmannii]PGC17899.1 hypothetical protein COM08_15470 [Bacillus wiedmannii]